MVKRSPRVVVSALSKGIMMINLKQAIARSESGVASAFAVFEAKTKFLLGTPPRTHAGIGDLILSAAKATSSDPKAELAQLEGDLAASLKDALAPIGLAEEEIQTLVAVVSFLRNGGQLNVSDLTTIAAAKAVRASHLLGTIDANVVANDLDRMIESAKQELERTKQFWFPKIARAKDVVVAKTKVAIYKSHGLDREAASAALRLTRVKALADWYASPQSRARLSQRQKRIAIKLGV